MWLIPCATNLLVIRQSPEPLRNAHNNSLETTHRHTYKDGDNMQTYDDGGNDARKGGYIRSRPRRRRVKVS